MFLYIYDNADVTFSGNGASALVTIYNTAVVNDPGWITIETHTHYSAHTHKHAHTHTLAHTFNTNTLRKSYYSAPTTDYNMH